MENVAEEKDARKALDKPGATEKNEAQIHPPEINLR